MADRACFPTACHGGMRDQAEAGWVKRLAENRYGRHAAWFAPPPESPRDEPVELVPWLLFNRELWDALPEQILSTDQDTLSLHIAHQETAAGGHPGWKVEMRLDMSSFAPVGITAVRADDEAAPGGDDFLPLPAGRPPPRAPATAAGGRRRRTLMAAAALVVGLVAAAGGWRWVAGDGTAQEVINNLNLRKLSADAMRTQLRAQLQGARSGLPAEEAYQLALGAMSLGAMMQWNGESVRWRGLGAPPGYECGGEEADGWRPCNERSGGG